MSAGGGLTKPNLYFAYGKIQIDSPRLHQKEKSRKRLFLFGLFTLLNAAVQCTVAADGGAPRSESKIIMIAGDNHTFI